MPYKGTAPAMTDLLGGQVDIMCDQTTNTTQPDRGRQGQGLRGDDDQAPDDAGADEAADARRVGPEGLQRDDLARAVRAEGHAEGGASTRSTPRCKAALKDADFIKREEALGAVVVTDARVGGAEHKKFVEAEINKWGPVIKAAGQYAD